MLLLDGTERDVTIVGIFTFGEANNLLGARLTAALDTATAQEVFGAAGQYDTIDVKAAPGSLLQTSRDGSTRCCRKVRRR